MGNQLSTDASCVTANRHTDPSNAGSKQRGIALAALTVPSSATDVGAAGTSAANLAPTNGALVLPGLELDAQQGPNPAVLVNQVAAKRRAQKWVHKLVKEAPTKMPGPSNQEFEQLFDDYVTSRDQLRPYASEEEYDYIIVGAGAAGCTLAHELIKSEPKLRILLLEAGPAQAYANDRIHAPFDCASLWQGYETDWGYMTEQQLVESAVVENELLINPPFFYPRGKVLGGSTATNAMIYIRGQPHDFDEWGAVRDKKYGAIWNWEACLEAFKATECNKRAEPSSEFVQYHGFGEGMLFVQDSNAGVYDVSQAVLDTGLRTFGLEENTDMNGRHQNGVGKFQVTMKDGRRCTVSDTYLKAATDVRIDLTPDNAPLPPGGNGRLTCLNVKSNCHVLRLLFDSAHKTAVTGVEFFYEGEVFAVKATREVILSAGAINTPQIMMLSGLGSAEHLSQHGLPVVHHLPGVGRGLMDHPLVPVTARVKKPRSTMQTNVHIWSNGAEVAYMFKADEQGQPTWDFRHDQPDIQINCAPSVWDQSLINPPKGGPPPFPGDGITFGIVLNAPRSRGWIALRDANPFSMPRIFTNYYTDPSDMLRMISAVKLARAQFKERPLADEPWCASEVGWDDEYGRFLGRTDAEIEAYIRAKTYTSFHPCGTCKMAPLKDGGVVDERLRVHGARNLRIVDASIFPVIPTGNLQAGVVMTAYKAARLIREDYVFGQSRKRAATRALAAVLDGEPVRKSARGRKIGAL